MSLIGKKISALIKNYSINWKNNSDKLNNSYILLSYNTGSGEYDNAVVNTKELLSYSTTFTENAVQDLNNDLVKKLNDIKEIQNKTKIDTYSYINKKDDEVLSYVSKNYPTISYLQHNYLDIQNTYSKIDITNKYYDKDYIDKLKENLSKNISKAVVDSESLMSYIKDSYSYTNVRINTTYTDIEYLMSGYNRLDKWLKVKK